MAERPFDEIEITPEMIEAGVNAYCYDYYESREQIVGRIFREMAAAKEAEARNTNPAATVYNY